MTDSVPALIKKPNRFSEVYARGEDGKLSTRLGFLGPILDVVANERAVNIQMNINLIDAGPLMAMVSDLPNKLAKREMVVACEAIAVLFNSFREHGDEHSLRLALDECRKQSPAFEMWLLDSLRSPQMEGINSHRHIDEFVSACEGYAFVLCVYLIAMMKSHPDSWRADSGIEKRLDAIGQEIQRVLSKLLGLPNRFTASSPLVKTFVDNRSNDFLRYLQYSEFSSSAEGVKDFYHCAKREIFEAENSRYGWSYGNDYYVIEKLIEVLRVFKFINAKRQGGPTEHVSDLLPQK